jgi:hypothetical protein
MYTVCGIDSFREREAWNGLIWLRIGTGEYGNKSSGSIECRAFLDQLRTSYSFSGRTLLHGVNSLSTALGKERHGMV